ncbi:MULTISPECIES: filamentous hemagglutinin N-terminal domain-containing protein [unclassified Microcoleus]|uniref:two-partner secretion domain-containing protein n=1 Tax=unclassified Microcoleus TaxID=2642155 RepID=UPI002FCFAD15
MPRLHSSLMFAFLLLFPTSSLAQIVPDSSLGAESSRLVPDNINNLPSDRISGGATRGVNLFHSLREFNIQGGRGAYFENPNGVANIFTRVTGGNSSNILGTLGVLGNANLFLINPKGIVFGPQARLDLRGSFLASSAGGVVFNNGFEFSAANPNAVPLLAINIPVGLRFRDNPGAIVNTSRVTQNIEGTEIPVGLAVPPGQTLALVGGDLTFNNGFASAFSGNIQLGSVASPGMVSFKIAPTGLGLDYTNVANFGNIELSGLSAVTASGPGGGAIALRGGNVILRDRASLVSDTLGSINGRDITVDTAQLGILDQAFISTGTSGTGAGGNVSVRATDAVEIKGIGFDNFRRNVLDAGTTGTSSFLTRQSGIVVGTVGAGPAGNITVDSKQLMLREGGLIINPSYGAGAGGNVALKASESVEVSESGLFTTAIDRGSGGNLTVDTAKLIVRNGSVLSSATVGAGDGGNLTVRASDSVLLTEYRLDSSFGTGIITNSIGGTGNAGNIEINTRSLLVEGGTAITSTSGFASRNGVIPAVGRGGNLTINATDSVTISGSSKSDSLSAIRIDRSQLITGTVAGGNSGDLRINTRRLTLQGATAIGASTLGAGNGGNIIINASESVELVGTQDNLSAFGIATASGEIVYQTLFQLAPPTGAAGNIEITTPRLTIRDGATIAIGSLGSGRSGNINVVASAIALDNKSSIDGTTASGVGANINLRSASIQLRRGSRITTDAGAADGGNINLNSDILVGQGNSDITANARSAAGGRVNVNVPNVLGFTALGREQVRSRLNLNDAQFAALQVSPTSLLPSSDIAAISQSAGPALQGTVTFSSSGVNPAQGLVELPQNVVDPAALIAANPCTLGAESAFTVTGRGGVPPSPNDVLSTAETPFPWVEIEGSAADSVTDVTDVTDSAAGNVRDLKDVTHKAKIEGGEKNDREVVPARGWVVNEKGEVTLVAAEAGGQFVDRTRPQVSVCQPR